MRKTIFTILITLGFVSGFGQNAQIIGKIILENPNDFERIVDKGIMLISRDTTIMSKIQPDLSFTFKKLKSDSIKLLTPYFTKEKTSYKFYIGNNETIELEIPYSYYCEYDKSENDNTCPICEKQNRVIPIVYGLVLNWNINPRKYWLGGCIESECKPHWYCKRDKFEF